MTLIGPRGGQLATLAEPRLVVEDGREGKIQIGGSVPVDVGSLEDISFGVGAGVEVHQLADGKLRLLLHLSQSDLDDREKPDVVVRESAVHCVKEVQPGAEFSVQLDGGLSAKGTVTVIPKA